MTQSEDANKALVIEAFDALFNKRDYAAAERFWSPNYIQHSAHIAPGRDGLFDGQDCHPPQAAASRENPQEPGWRHRFRRRTSSPAESAA